MHLEAPSEATKAIISATAQEALPTLAPTQTIWNAETLKVTAADAAQLAARFLLGAAKNGVQLSDAILDTAQRTLEQPADQSVREAARTGGSEHQGSSSGGAGDFIDELLAAAKRDLDRVKSLASHVGLTYVELPTPEAPVGVGVAIAFEETQYVVLSVMGGGNEGQLYITAGVLRDIRQDRETALGLCNGMVRENPAYPIFLHDAQFGWDVLVSNVFPIQLLADNPTFFANAVRALPIVADDARFKFLQADLGGQPFQLNDEDLNRLLTESMI